MKVIKSDNIFHLIVISVIIGILVGLISIIFHFSLSFLDQNVFRGLTGYEETTSIRAKSTGHIFVQAGQYRPWLMPVVIGLGGLLAGIIVAKYAPDTRGHGTDQAVKAYHHGNAVIKGRVPIVKTIASVITLGFGGSGGAEGPMVQSGAGIGSLLARRFNLSVRERRILLVAGMAAGLGSFFKSPIAGAIFCNEILYRDGHFEDDALVPATVAAVIGYIVYSLAYGFSPLFDTPHSAFLLEWFHLFPLTILAVSCSLFGSLFVYVFYTFHDFFENLKLPLWIKPAIGGFLTGLLAIFITTTPGSSYNYLQAIFRAELPLLAIIGLLFGKMLATSFSIGSGGSGGVFGPSMVIGGSVGGATGIIYNMLVSQGFAVNSGTMSVLGMAGFFTAVANTPISTLIMVSEMTGDFSLLVPGLWVIGISYMLSRRYSIYREQIRDSINSPAFRDNYRCKLLSRHRIEKLMNPEIVLSEGFDENDLDAVKRKTLANAVPYIDKNRIYKGMLPLEKTRNTLQSAEDLLLPGKTISPLTPLDIARGQFGDQGHQLMAVVDENGKYLGTISENIIDYYILKRVLSNNSLEL